MKVIIKKDRAKKLLKNIQSNFDAKGAALELEAKAISQRLGRRLTRLCDASFRLTMHTDFTKRMIKEGKMSIFDISMEIEDDRSMIRIINQLEGEETPCRGYVELENFCNQEESDSMIVTTEQLDIYIKAQTRDYSLYDFHDLRSRKALAAHEQIKLFKKLRLYKSVVGHYPMEKNKEDDKTVCLDQKIEEISEKIIEITGHQDDSKKKVEISCILVVIALFAIALGTFGIFLIH